jgi:hypothetical protein
MELDLTKAVFNTVSTLGIRPVNSTLGTDDAAGAALQTTFVIEYQLAIILVPLVVFCRADIKTRTSGTGFAELLFYRDMGLFMNLKFNCIHSFFN